MSEVGDELFCDAERVVTLMNYGYLDRQCHEVASAYLCRCWNVEAGDVPDLPRSGFAVQGCAHDSSCKPVICGIVVFHVLRLLPRSGSRAREFVQMCGDGKAGFGEEIGLLRSGCGHGSDSEVIASERLVIR